MLAEMMKRDVMEKDGLMELTDLKIMCSGMAIFKFRA